jgi:hypothetical protein
MLHYSVVTAKGIAQYNGYVTLLFSISFSKYLTIILLNLFSN